MHDRKYNPYKLMKSFKIAYRKTLLFSFLSLFSLSVLAVPSETSKDETYEYSVESIRRKLPIQTPSSGTITSVVSPSQPLTVTINMGSVDNHTFRAYMENPNLLKRMLTRWFQALGEDCVGLAHTAYNAGIPFAIHTTADGFAEGFTITFSPEELGEIFNIKK